MLLCDDSLANCRSRSIFGIPGQLEAAGKLPNDHFEPAACRQPTTPYPAKADDPQDRCSELEPDMKGRSVRFGIRQKVEREKRIDEKQKGGFGNGARDANGVLKSRVVLVEGTKGSVFFRGDHGFRPKQLACSRTQALPSGRADASSRPRANSAPERTNRNVATPKRKTQRPRKPSRSSAARPMLRSSDMSSTWTLLMASATACTSMFACNAGVVAAG